jgi:energy-coupling factor transporter ATP-binding protein EcfA2
MNLQIAQRKNAKMKMALMGPSGSGKTYSALLLAYGISKDWSKVIIIDTENNSADLYSNLGPYYVCNISSPFTPEKYIEALHLCEKSEADVIIIDSISHEWEYLLDYHANLPGNSFTAWAKVTPRQNAFVQAILQSPSHVICTIRTKQDYVLVEKNGKQVPEKVGLKFIQRDGLDFEFTLVFDLDIKNNASTSKDRTGLFFGKPEHKITCLTGEQIAEWCSAGLSEEMVLAQINQASTVQDLYHLYRQHPSFQESLKPRFEQRKLQLTP